jgi:hypothetical protein
MKYNARTIPPARNRWLLGLILTSLSMTGTAPSTACVQQAPATLRGTVTEADVQSDMVLDWNAHAANAIVGVAGQRPERGLIRLAMVHVAIYDAVNAIDGYPFQSYAVNPNVVSPASPEAATAAAAYEMLVALFPAQQADLYAKYTASLATILDGPSKTNGILVGQQTAVGILALRANDGRDAVVLYTPGSGPGVWMPTPPAFLPAAAPETPRVQPFTINSPSQFRAEPPPDLTVRRGRAIIMRSRVSGQRPALHAQPSKPISGAFGQTSRFCNGTEHGEISLWSATSRFQITLAFSLCLLPRVRTR